MERLTRFYNRGNAPEGSIPMCTGSTPAHNQPGVLGSGRTQYIPGDA